MRVAALSVFLALMAVSSLATEDVAQMQCPSNALRGGTHRRTIFSGGRFREYKVVVPTRYNNTAPLRLVVAIHCYTCSADSFERMSRISSYVNDEDFIVAYPQGISNSFNAGTCCGTAAATNVADYDFIGIDMINDLKANLCIDSSNIFATGFSNGCMMTHGLLCIFPHVFKAGSCSAGCMALSEGCCNRWWNEVPSATTSVMHTHGTSDLIVPYGGSLWCPGVQSTDNAWAQSRLGCSAGSFQWYEGGRYSCRRRNSCQNGETLELCTATGGGHVWYYDINFDQTKAVLQFFGILPYCWEDNETDRCSELAFNVTGDVSLDYIAEMEKLASSAHSAALNEQASFMLNSPEGACPYAGRKND